MKTLIGKNDYLFLQNDTNQEIEVHRDNLFLVKSDFSNKYNNNYLLSVFPDKSIICKDYLPDGYDMKYRPGIDTYKEQLNHHIFDLLPFLSGKDTYYKTDTHMNLLGAYISYQNVVNRICELFKINLQKINIGIEKKECVLSELNIGIGDLTWEMNLGNQILKNKIDNFYYSDDINNIYCTYKIQDINIYNLSALNYDLVDETKINTGEIIDWYFVSKYIIHTKNKEVDNKYKIIIFYDSFLLSSLDLWIKTFYEVYFVKTASCQYLFSSSMNNNLIEKINPDFILEFKAERYLM